MATTKFTANTAVVAALADLPNATSGLTPAQLKAKFDESPTALKAYINDVLTVEIDAGSTAGSGALTTHKTSSDHDGRYYTETEIDANLVTKTDLTTTRKLSATGNFTGTLNGAAIVASEPGLSSLFTAHVAETVTGIVNAVKGFGADPTGIADSSAAIQAAIDSNASFIAVYLPTGDYKLSTGLVINRQNLLLFGAGRATTLLPAAGVTAINVGTLNGVSNTKISDMRIYGQTNAVSGITLGDGAFTAFTCIENVSIENFKSIGSQGIKMAKVQELDIHNCYIADNYNCLTAPVGTGNFVTSVHVHGESGYIGRAVNLGILLDIPVASFSVTDIVVESNVGGGIASLGKGSQINMERVHFENNTGSNTIYIKGTALGAAKFTINGCFFFGNSAPILRTDYVIDSKVSDNVGLIGTGNIVTTANSGLHLELNRGEDVALNQDAILLYNSLLGKITYLETSTTGQRILKMDNIKFPATQVPSSDPNTLDDYEEGTWSAGLVSATSGTITLSGNNGTYTKIGRLVTVSCFVNVSAVSSPVGELRLTGLPFTVVGQGVFPVFGYGLSAGATTALVGLAEASQTYAVISKYAAGGVTALSGDVQAGTGMFISFTYTTNT